MIDPSPDRRVLRVGEGAVNHRGERPPFVRDADHHRHVAAVVTCVVAGGRRERGVSAGRTGESVRDEQRKDLC